MPTLEADIPIQAPADPGQSLEGASSVRRPLVTLRPPGRWAALRLGELVAFRDLLFTLAQRDVKLRYKQTMLGVSWVVLQPLLAAGIFTFVFGLIAKLPSDGVPYFLFSFAGLLGWNLFNNVMTRSSGCLVSNAHLISKVFFPRLVLPISSIGSALIDFAVALGMMALLLVVYRWLPGAGLALLPVWLTILLLLAFGVGIWTAALSVSYRDVQYVMPVFIQILFYASPVPYGASLVPKHLQGIYYLNPVSAPLEAVRSALLGTPLPPVQWLAYSAAMAAFASIAGLIAFKRMERRFADVI